MHTKRQDFGNLPKPSILFFLGDWRSRDYFHLLFQAFGASDFWIS
jgi:hypothetical protein